MCLEDWYIHCFPLLSTEKKQQDSVMSPAVLALGGCLPVAGRDPQKLSTFHFDYILDFFPFDSYFLGFLQLPVLLFHGQQINH